MIQIIFKFKYVLARCLSSGMDFHIWSYFRHEYAVFPDFLLKMNPQILKLYEKRVACLKTFSICPPKLVFIGLLKKTNKYNW